MEMIYSLLLAGENTGRTGFIDPQQWSIILIMVVFVGFFYFFIVRPQNKKRKDLEQMLNALQKGDRVVTIGGIHGKVVNSKDNEVVLRVDDNTEITFERNAVSRVLKETKNTPVKSTDSKK